MTETSENRLLPGGGIHHIAVQTYDEEASLRLYRDVLGMRIVKVGGREGRRVTLLDIGNGSHIELVAPAGGAPQPVPELYSPLLHIALATTDVHTVIEHVRSSGYEITVEPKQARHAMVAFFKGPNDELIELYQAI
jgi:glyoxylase I family protein